MHTHQANDWAKASPIVDLSESAATAYSMVVGRRDFWYDANCSKDRDECHHQAIWNINEAECLPYPFIRSTFNRPHQRNSWLGRLISPIAYANI